MQRTTMFFATMAGMLLIGAANAREHPFILWTTEDIAAIRKKIETEPWAKARYQKMVENPDPDEQYLANLLRYAVMGDAEAGEAEKKELMATVRSPVPRGAAQYLNVLRYDLLYDSLTADERRDVERFFRTYIENHVFRRAVLDPKVFNNSRNYARYDAKEYTRTNWLPNITWPWRVSGNLMAMALQDEKLIRKTWAAYGSWKWYFDEYLCDTGFYSEEFSKIGSTPGAMLLYCRGLERLGLGELGYGYKGKGGATMRGHIESLIHLGYPRVDLGSDRPHYPIVTLGDMRQSGSSQRYNFPGYAFQQSLVMGYLPNGQGGTLRWIRHGAWGGERRGDSPQWDRNKTPKMLAPLWFEIGHGRWPDAGFDYFLAQMRGPDEKQYIPSLFFGLDPLDPRKVKPPSAPSAVWPERGLVILRADESPAYWESEAPAVCMRLATNYAHNVNDPFALAGFYAFGRPIYLNRQTCQSYAQGYSRSIQSHCGVVVDGLEPKFTDATTVRKDFQPQVKFVAARSKEVYTDVDLTRALFLTREYLLDITSLRSPKPRQYHWLVHALGRPDAKRGKWKPCDKIPGLSPDFKNVRRRESDMLDSGLFVRMVQDCPTKDPAATVLGRPWYAKRVGVYVWVSSEMPRGEPERAPGGNVALSPGMWFASPDATAFLADTPPREPHARKPPPGPDEIGGTTLVVGRKCPETTFIAVHQPFRNASSPFRKVGSAERDQAVWVHLAGKSDSGLNDHLLFRFGDDCTKPITLPRDRDKSFTFTGHTFVRISKNKVEVSGNLQAMRIRVEGKPQLIVNGQKRKATISKGILTFEIGTESK